MNSEELKKLEDNLWQTADTLRTSSDLKSTEYSTPVLYPFLIPLKWTFLSWVNPV